MWKFSSNWQFWFFGSNLPKRVFPIKNWKSELIEFCIVKLVLVPNFRLSRQFWFFLPDLPKKGFSGIKQKKWTPHIFYIIQHVQISLVRNICSKWQFWFFGPNLPKKVFPVENRKTEHPHGILHIWISLGTNFSLNW